MEILKFIFLITIVTFGFRCVAQEGDYDVDSHQFSSMGKSYSAPQEGLKRKYQFQITGGIVLLSLGVTSTGIGVALKDKTTTTGNLYSGGIQVKDYKKQSRIATALGAVGMIAGIYLISKGIVNKKLYVHQVSIGPTFSSIAIKF